MPAPQLSKGAQAGQSKPPQQEGMQGKPQESEQREDRQQSNELDFDETLSAVASAAPNLGNVVERIRTLGHAIMDPLS